MNLAIWIAVGFGVGVALGVAADRMGLWGRSKGHLSEEQKPPKDLDPYLPPFPRLRPPPR